MLFIFILALILIGPKQLPEVARNVGRFLNEMKRASAGLFEELKKPPVTKQANNDKPLPPKDTDKPI